MAYYAYKDVIYRADFQALCEGFSAKYGRELDPDPGYDGDYWGVAADLLEAKDAEIEALKAKLADCQSVLRSRGHHESCDAGWCFHVTTLHPIRYKMGTKYASHVCRPMSACSDAVAFVRKAGHLPGCGANVCQYRLPGGLSGHCGGTNDQPQHRHVSFAIYKHAFQPGECSCGHDRIVGSEGEG